AEAGVERVEGGGGVGLATTRRDRRRGRRDRDVVERARVDLPGGRRGLAGEGTGDGVCARDVRGAARTRARAVRRDAEGRARGHVAAAVVELVPRSGRVGLAATGRDRGRGGSDRDVVEGSG